MDCRLPPPRTLGAPSRGAMQRGGVLVLLVVALVRCGPRTDEASEGIERFIDAVQGEDPGRLYCLLAGAATSVDLGADEATRRETFRDWAGQRFRGYYEGRDAGWVEPEEDGIALVKMFALGKGTFYQVESPRALGPDELRARMRVRFGYPAIDLSGFPAGTTLYVCDAPVGRVEPVRIPNRGQVRTQVLESVSLDWTLVRSEGGGGCSPGWAVAAVEVEAGSVRVEQVTWVF